MITIYKYPLSLAPVDWIETHRFAQFLKVGVDPAGAPCLWAKIDTTLPKFHCPFYTVGTGREIPEGARNYLGTFNDGPDVAHIFTT